MGHVRELAIRLGKPADPVALQDLTPLPEELSLRSTELEPERNGLRPLHELLSTLEDLSTVLESAGDAARLEAVGVQKERVAGHLARLTARA